MHCNAELTRDADQQNPRARALLGDMDEDPANKKVVSVLCLSLGEAAKKLFNSLHYGHPGRDAMLSMVGDIWWPRIHREVIDQARLCDQC